MELIILSLIVIASYVGVMIRRNGIPYSISDTYYSLEHKAWFGFSIISTALLLMPSILERTPESYQFLAFLMCAGLCFVGVAPNFKTGLDRPVHIVATSIAALCSQVWVVLAQPWIMVLWIVYVMWIVFNFNKSSPMLSFYNRLASTKPLFYAEVVIIITVYATILY